MSEEIDQLDARLLLTLRAYPRVGVVEVARRLGVARGTVQARMDKLAARGVITGYGPDVEPARMGYPVLAFVSLEIVQGRLEEVTRHDARTLARVEALGLEPWLDSAGPHWMRIVPETVTGRRLADAP